MFSFVKCETPNFTLTFWCTKHISLFIHMEYAKVPLNSVWIACLFLSQFLCQSHAYTLPPNWFIYWSFIQCLVVSQWLSLKLASPSLPVSLSLLLLLFLLLVFIFSFPKEFREHKCEGSNCWTTVWILLSLCYTVMDRQIRAEEEWRWWQ